ncbi:hypothetical protein P8452_51449 [Trifolium repens]|nr:hypothetical protein P8452_51449 [Trifolium repens]
MAVNYPKGQSIIMAVMSAEPVLDISGKKVTTGVKYYILPVFRGKGGGLTVSNVNNLNSGNSTCPLYVLQEKLEVKNGQTVTFTPYNAKQVLSGVWFLATGGVEVSTTQTLCRELGLFVDDTGNKHLALSDQVPSFRVVFKRA